MVANYMQELHYLIIMLAFIIDYIIGEGECGLVWKTVETLFQ